MSNICKPSCRSAHKRAPGGLGKDARKVVGECRDGLRLERFAAKRKAAQLLRADAPKTAKRISDCCYVAHGDEVTLSEVTNSDGSKSAAWGGVVTCRNVWACPVCSARIADERRAELNALLAWARAKGHAVHMLTLTHRHARREALADNLGRMKAALKTLRQSRTWRALPLVGNVTASEVTYGQANGWHVHFHILLISQGSADDAAAQIEAARPEWSRSLGKAGLTGNAHAFQLQAASQAGSYVAKFGAGEEIALGHAKQGRGGSRSPWQLLADARDGDAHAGHLFVEYALSFAGRRQLFWSRGLKALADIDETVKAEADGEAAQRSEPVVLRSWPGCSMAWRHARRRRVAITHAVEQGTSVDEAEFGPSDAERWRRSLDATVVVEP